VNRLCSWREKKIYKNKTLNNLLVWIQNWVIASHLVVILLENQAMDNNMQCRQVLVENLDWDKDKIPNCILFSQSICILLKDQI
jgi:hypothetical protein